MSDIQLNAVLTEMRRLAALAGTEAAAAPAQTDFASMFKTMLENVNDTQQQAADLARAFELGEEGADLADVMLNLQKSRLSFQATLQVRNKLVAAYQDIMNMPI